MNTTEFGSLAAAGAIVLASLSPLVLPACSSPPPAQSSGHVSPQQTAHEPGGAPDQPADPQQSKATNAGTATGAILQVSVKGMSCPQCAYNINQQLYKLPGVADVIVDLGEGLVTAKLSGEARPTRDQVDYAIRLAGFTPDRIEFK